MALCSLLVQTYANWECIIVNDGSTDETKSLLDTFHDNRFKVIHLEKNVGRSAARQIGLDNAEGKYLAYLDADDFYHHDKLRKQVELLENNPLIDLVGATFFTFDMKFRPVTCRAAKNHSGIIYYNFGETLHVSTATVLIRLHRAKTIKYNTKLKAGEDTDYFSRYLDGGAYINIPEINYYYLVSTETTTYRKVLQYTGNEILRGLSVFKRKRRYALLIIIRTSVKWIIYACCIPILGVNFFLQKRGFKPSKDEIKCFEEQLSIIRTKVNDTCRKVDICQMNV